jgi:hypothetical protein
MNQHPAPDFQPNKIMKHGGVILVPLAAAIGRNAASLT